MKDSGLIVRFDDTNPEAEEEKYFLAIEDNIRWLGMTKIQLLDPITSCLPSIVGFTPAAVTHSSDHFPRLYELAEKLIKLGKGYVCHCNEAEIKLQRGGEKGAAGPRYRCEHANQDVETNLQKFRDMRDGKYEPQQAFLRMKQDIENNNPQMWDLAAYRVLNGEHHRTKNQWKIYATYDFAHCLCDSFEGITHSFCTTEFILSRESYEWLNKTLGVYEPMQREFGETTLIFPIFEITVFP